MKGTSAVSPIEHTLKVSHEDAPFGTGGILLVLQTSKKKLL
jgi:hypothetical protein